MSTSVATVRARRDLSWAKPEAARERWVRCRVGIAWSLLVLNVLTFYPRTWSGMPLAVPIPPTIGKLITQGALPAALLVALTVNRRIAVRPNVFLCLVALLVIGTLMTGLQAQHIGTVYRALRFAGFVVTLWLLSPWWGRRDLLLVRCQLAVTSVVLGLVLLGLLVAPGTARAQGRLAGALWPTPPTQVAEFAAVTTGLVIVLWLAGLMPGRVTLLVVSVAGAMLLLTHTRTALIAMMAGVLVAGLSLFTARTRVRKLFAAGGAVVAIGAITLSGVVTTWLIRGESSQQLSKLTGRTTVWHGVVSIPRNKFEVFFGFGLSNKSFNGLPIDSNWLATYFDQGLFGVAVSAAILLFLLVTAYFQPRGVQRAIALFLVTYCLLASLTETSFSDASTYLLYLALAASLLVPSFAGKGPA
jgi:hypothetical protein